MPSLPGVLPYPLGVGSASSGLYTPTGYGYNYAVGGLPFLSAATRENPLVRSTAPFRKQQFDNSNEPGEQSIDGWWIRSQMSFHDGAGQLYADPSAVDSSFSASRFYTSAGIDPWTAGQVTLLQRTTNVSATPLFHLTGTTSKAIGTTNAGGVGTVNNGVLTTEASPGGSPLDTTTDGLYFYVATTNGIYQRLISDAAGSPWTKIWNLSGITFANIGWVKQRLVLAIDTGVYELASGGPGLPAAKWTPPSSGWSAAGHPFAESSTAIYVAGYGGLLQGYVLAFTLDGTGSMPTLSSGAVVAQLPVGEYINSIYSYLNQFLAFGTNRGARIARIGSDSSLEVGPLLFEDGSVGPWVGKDRFLYCGMTGGFGTPEARTFRVDLGEEIANLRFAYAPDMVCANGGGVVYGLVLYQTLTDTFLVSTSGGLYQMYSSAGYVDSGYLQTSRIRFDTLEPKIYKLLRVRGAQTLADFYVSIIDQDGGEHSVIGYVGGQTPGEEDADLPDLGPQDFVSVKFTLSSASSNTISASCGGYQIKALPATPRQRIIRIPLWCFDFETDANGVITGYEGSASARLAALEDLDRAADVINLQDLDRGTVERCVIEEVQFVHTSMPPTGFNGYGGVITLTVRTV